MEISETVATPEQGAKAGTWGFRGVFSMETPGRCLAWKHPSEGQVWWEGAQSGRVLCEVQVAETWVGREQPVDDEEHSTPG